MTSSLVGSEMCIRDRWGGCAHCSSATWQLTASTACECVAGRDRSARHWRGCSVRAHVWCCGIPEGCTLSSHGSPSRAIPHSALVA
eukprot:11760942-Prorocentrum_lima.AAC.1